MSEYLNELQDSARQVVDGAGTPASEETTWPLLVELGWLLTMVPEELDGLGLGIQEACALHTELGRGLAEVPLLSTMLAIEALSQSDLGDKAERIANIAAGECITASLTASGISLGESRTLSGLQLAVPSADKASQILVWTQASDCVVLVGLDQAGVQVTRHESWDTTRRLFDIQLQDVALEQQLVLAEGAAAASLITRLETVRDFSLAADSLGSGTALLEQTVEYLTTRQQFGRPLALFQALKHRCADMKMLLAGAEALLINSLGSIDENLAVPGAQLKAKKVKYLACSAFMNVAEEALQLHGGIGMASEHPCHLYLKRAMLNEHLGDNEDSYVAAIADSFLSANS